MRTSLYLAAVLTLSGGLPVRADEPPPFYPDKAKLLVVRDSAGRETAVKTPEDWAKRRSHILAGVQAVMGPLPAASKKVPLDVQVLEEVRTDKYARRKVSFAAEKGDRVTAYLFLPAGERGRRPAVLCLHPTDRTWGKGVPAGLSGKPDRHYAVHLAERGYVTLAPDYPGSGDSKCNPCQLGYASATMKGIWNHMRAVDLLQDLPEVDGERIGVIGHSLGGHNSLFVSAFDPRIRCTVTNCGFCSFPTYMKGNLAGWSHDGYMPRLRTVYGLKPEKVPFDFPEVLAAIAPRAVLAIAPVRDDNFDVAGARACVEAARPVYELLGSKDKLAGFYPDCGHDFPDESRRTAYAWLERWLSR